MSMRWGNTSLMNATCGTNMSYAVVVGTAGDSDAVYPLRVVTPHNVWECTRGIPPSGWVSLVLQLSATLGVRVFVNGYDALCAPGVVQQPYAGVRCSLQVGGVQGGVQGGVPPPMPPCFFKRRPGEKAGGSTSPIPLPMGRTDPAGGAWGAARPPI